MRQAVEDRADLRRFRTRPHPRLLVGLALVFLGLLLGWPAVSLCGTLALALGDPFFIVIVAPIVYGISWVIYLAGFLVGGLEAVRYVRDFNRWLVRIIVGWLLGETLDDEPEP